MRGSQTLMQAMDAVAKGIETMPERVPVRPHKPKAEAMSELDAFAVFDPLLADLQKEFLNTKARSAQLRRKNGVDDPMADMAADLEDSAWCRMQTRYLELRSQRQLMDKAQKLMREAEREDMREELKQKQKKQAALFHSFMMLEKLKQKRAAYVDTFVLLFLAILFDKEDQRLREAHLPLHQRFAA